MISYAIYQPYIHNDSGQKKHPRLDTHFFKTAVLDTFNALNSSINNHL